MASLASQVAPLVPPMSAKDLGLSDQSGGIDDFLRQAKSDDAKFEAKTKPLLDKMENIGEKVEKTPDIKVPELTKVPKPEIHSPLDAFGSAAGWISVFGSMLTRRPLINSLNASAAVINAQREGDEKKFKDSMEIWKAETENASKLHQFEMDTYKSVMDKYGAESDITQKELSVLTSAFKNTTAQQMNMMRMMSSYTKGQEEHQGVLLKNQTFQDWFSNNPNATPAEQLKEWKNINSKTNVSSSEPTLSPEAIEKAADAVAKGARLSTIVPGFGKNNPNRDAVMNLLAEKYPEVDLAKVEAEYAGQVSEARSVGTQTAKINLASNMLDQSLPSMMTAAEKVGLTPSTDLNTVFNTIKRHASNKELSNFSTQLRAVTSDYAQFIGRGRLTVHSDEEALRILNEDMGITSLQGFVDAVNTEKQNVARAIDITKGKKIDGDVSKVDGVDSAFDNTGNGASLNAPLSMPKDMKFIKGKYYDTPQGVGKYLGDGRFE